MGHDFIIAGVKDELTETFLQPIFGESKEELLRIFTYEVNSIPLWKANASDYSFYQIGRFNSLTGEIIPQLSKLATGHSVIKKEENNDILNFEDTRKKANS